MSRVWTGRPRRRIPRFACYAFAMVDLISKRLRSLLSDYLAQGSVLRAIERAFDAEDIPFVKPREESGGQRRTMVQGYYHGLDFAQAADVRRFLNVLAFFLQTIERQIPEEHPWSPSDGEKHWAALKLDEFQAALAKDGYAYRDGDIVGISAAGRLLDAKAIAGHFDARHIHEQIKRIEASVDTDPALAIGTAKELVESCFKTILKDRAIEYGNGDDLPQLGKKVFKALRLVPDDVPEAAKGADTIRRLLSNLATVTQGLAEMRSLYGTGHGKEGRSKGVSPRHAKLAVGAASTLVTFVFETHQENG